MKVIALHDLVTISFVPGQIIDVVSDAKDNNLFALALESAAEFLVTGDKLLLDVDEYRTTKDVSLNAFRNIVL